MPEDVMKKYKKGELPADYSKDTPVIKAYSTYIL